MITEHDAVLLLIDLQEKLLRAMHDREDLERKVSQLIQGFNVLGIPVLWTEQNPKGLGSTIEELKALLNNYAPVSKMTFSCCGEPEFMNKMKAYAGRTIFVSGIESHVCVYQTIADLINFDYQVQIVTDAVSSRTPQNLKLGINKCEKLGASPTSVETILFEAMRTAEHPKFKEIQKIIR